MVEMFRGIKDRVKEKIHQIKKRGIKDVLRGDIKESIYAQPASKLNLASRYVAEKLATPDQAFQEKLLNQLEAMSKKLTDLWQAPARRSEFKRDNYAWANHEHHGNYQKKDLTYRGRETTATFSAYDGVIDSQAYWGKLSRVGGYVSAGQQGDEHFSEAAYFEVDIGQPYIGPHSARNMAEVKLNGGQLLTPEMRRHNIKDVSLAQNGLEVHINQFDDQLQFKDRTQASVWYTAGEMVKDKRYAHPIVVGPNGPICQIKLLVSSTERFYPPNATHIDGDSNWISISIGPDGNWVPAEKTDKFGRTIIVSAETIMGQDVMLTMQVGDETKTMYLPKLEVSGVMNLADNLVNSLLR